MCPACRTEREENMREGEREGEKERRREEFVTGREREWR